MWDERWRISGLSVEAKVKPLLLKLRGLAWSQLLVLGLPVEGSGLWTSAQLSALWRRNKRTPLFFCY